MEPLPKLKLLREAAGLSQNALAGLIGKSHTYVRNVEIGQERLANRDTIHAWANALDVLPEEVYRAIDAVPHDLLDVLTDTDPHTWGQETWDQIRRLLESEE